MNQHILLTGATGMLGKQLIPSLLARGYQVSVLSRKPQQIKDVNVFLWDVNRQEIDVKCLIGVDSIIHLAGENVSEGKWTEKRKKEIIDSRVLSAQLMMKTLSETKHQVKDFISAAAVGYYGDQGDQKLTEDHAPGNDFLARCCVQWEAAADELGKLGLRIAKIRTGVVLAKSDGALPVMSVPIKLFAGAPLGDGRQWVPWIHHQDLTAIYLHILENKTLSGVYNACAPFPVTNKMLTKAIAKQLHRPVWPINVPEAVMKMILGEMSVIVLNSTRTSVQNITNTGFRFSFEQLEQALADIYHS